MGTNDSSDVNPKDLIGVKKPRLYLVPPASIIYQALAMQDGAAKYRPYNWREKKVRASIYIDAALRHIYAFLDGEDNADDSGVPHLGHALACLGILADAKESGSLIDDRPTPGPAPDLIVRWTASKEITKNDKPNSPARVDSVSESSAPGDSAPGSGCPVGLRGGYWKGSYRGGESGGDHPSGGPPSRIVRDRW